MTDRRRKKRRAGLLTALAGAALLLIAAVLTGRELLAGRRAGQTSAEVAAALSAEMPERKPAYRSVSDFAAHAGLGKPFSAAELPEDAEVPLYLLAPRMPMPTAEIDGRSYIGAVTIPALGLELPVLEKCTYAGLRAAPARWSGSAYTDDLVLCAHNYQRHFGALKTLAPETRVTFTDMDGNLFRYRVAAVEILRPESVAEMEESGFALTLYTCTVGGEARVTVRCSREDV